MGWCHEFGLDVAEGCDHPVTPRGDSCRCEVCGRVCAGRFEGCAHVWERGPLDIEIVRKPRAGRGAQRSRPVTEAPVPAAPAVVVASPPAPAPPRPPSECLDEAPYAPDGRTAEPVAWGVTDVASSSNGHQRGDDHNGDAGSLGVAIDQLGREVRELRTALSSADTGLGGQTLMTGVSDLSGRDT